MKKRGMKAITLIDNYSYGEVEVNGVKGRWLKTRNGWISLEEAREIIRGLNEMATSVKDFDDLIRDANRKRVGEGDTEFYSTYRKLMNTGDRGLEGHEMRALNHIQAEGIKSTELGKLMNTAETLWEGKGRDINYISRNLNKLMAAPMSGKPSYEEYKDDAEKREGSGWVEKTFTQSDKGRETMAERLRGLSKTMEVKDE